MTYEFIASTIPQGGPYILEITLYGLPKTNAGHTHWAKAGAERRKWRKHASSLAFPQRPRSPLSKCRLTCTRFSTVAPDYDNLSISFKSVIDGLKDAKIIVDDKPSCVVDRKYLWEKAKRGQGRITVRVEEISNDGI